MKIEVSIEELRKYKIFVGTPMYGAQCAGTYTKSSTDLAMMCTANGIDVKFYYLFNESLIQRARNYIADEFMRSDCTHLLFIDADIGFNPRDVLGLLAVQITDPEKYNVVTGPYPKKTIAWEKVQKAAAAGKGAENPFELENYTADYVFNPVNRASSFNIGEPLEIGEGGTGFMLIPRATFEKFAATYPELSYKPDHARTDNFDGSREIHAYFDCIIDPETKRYLSEDYFFCKKSRQAGMKIWMCPWMQLQHIGSYIFKGSLGHIGELGMSATADKSSSKKSYKNKK
tara:strand:+ start:9012 stop:9872 length:861 start_codon:yes stop_codon:yes gene_type:complete